MTTRGQGRLRSLKELGAALPLLAFAALVVAPTARAAEPQPAGTSPPPAAPAGPSMGRGRMRGEVGLSRREKLTGAVVVLLRQGDDENLFMTASDSFGVFQFDGIPEGLYTVIALRDGLRPARKEGIEVRAPFRADVDILMSAGEEPAPAVGSVSSVLPNLGAPAPTIRLTVVAQGGVPVEGARMSLRARDGSVDPIRGQSGTDGNLDFPRPPPGEYLLRIEAPGYLPLHLERTGLGSGSRAVKVFLTPRPFDHAGTPTDLLPEEKPVPPVDLRAQPLPAQPAPMAPPSAPPGVAPIPPAPGGSAP